MCWNPDISINTFVFAFLSLLFIYFTNTFTKYKIKGFENPLIYVFFIFVVSIQLIEFFLWRNLKNNVLNRQLSTLTKWVINLQPFILMLMINNLQIRYLLIFIYLFFIVSYSLFREIYSPINFHTSVAKNGHLLWEWMPGPQNIILYLGLLFYIVLLILINNTLLSIFIFSSILISLFFYVKDGTFGTMWCWIANLFFLYLPFHILIIMPFLEYNGLC
jgi:hypothetical protein